MRHILPATADPRRHETPDYDSDYEFPVTNFDSVNFYTIKEFSMERWKSKSVWKFLSWAFTAIGLDKETLLGALFRLIQIFKKDHEQRFSCIATRSRKRSAVACLYKT